MQFKIKVIRGIDRKKIMSVYIFFLKNKNIEAIKGIAIIVEYNAQSGSNGIIIGSGFKIF